MKGYSRAIMEIDAEALRQNCVMLRGHATSARLIAILKANAYGHGLINTAQILKEKADGFGVACLGEALQLRVAGIKNTIVILEGAFSKEEYVIASKSDLDMVIHDEYQYQWLEQLPDIKPIRVWLKVNTGMNRLGIAVHQVQNFITKLKALSVVKAIVVMSHLAHTDYKSALMNKQHNLFKRIIQSQLCTELTYSLANSAGMLSDVGMHNHWVRPGIALYGVLSSDKKSVLALKPVMTLKARVIAIRLVEPGECVGYYGKFRCKVPTRVGIVSFGYGDGYPYDAPDGTPVLINNRRAFLIGQVSMDMLSIDVSSIPDVKIGDEVTLWGKGLPLAEIANSTNRSCYELLCGVQRELTSRLHVEVA